MVKPETFFDIYEKTKPAEVKIETPKEETLFTPEKKEEPNQQTFELPEGFEDGLVEKITASIIAKLSEQKGGEENE